MIETTITRSRRLALEIAAIAGSILLAFAIDAWWENRQESKSDNIQLTSVLNELRIHRKLLDESIAAHRATIIAGGSILDYISSEGVDMPASGVPVTISRLLNFYQINAPFGALETAMLAGAIPRMSNNELATSLANWPVAIEDLLEEQVQGYQLLFSLLSTLSERLPMAAVYKEKIGNQTIRGTSEIAEIQTYKAGASPFHLNPELMFEDHNIENELLLLMILAQSAEAEATSFSNTLDDLIGRLDTCLRSASC